MIGSNILNKGWFAAVALTAALGGSHAAVSGEASYPQALGFSADGTRFAFAEWGVQDGSGFGFANVYVLNLTQDTWFGNPIRVLEQDETQPPRHSYDRALALARELLVDASITEPARQAFAGPLVYPKATRSDHKVTWQYRSVGSSPQSSFMIGLDMFEIAAPRCADPAYGYAYWVNDTEVYRDSFLPNSRGCPQAYSLERVYLADTIHNASHGVALVGVHRQGFEGLSMRHIAIPIPLKITE